MRRALLSIFIVFHLACILTVPQTSNELSEKISPWISGYARTFAFVGKWGFFAPEPGPHPTYLEWETTDKDGHVLSEGTYPERSTYFLKERLIRRVASISFMLNKEGRAALMMTPYLCQKDAGAFAVRLTWVLYPIPPLQEAARGKLVKDETSIQRRSASYGFCGEEI